MAAVQTRAAGRPVPVAARLPLVALLGLVLALTAIGPTAARPAAAQAAPTAPTAEAAQDAPVAPDGALTAADLGLTARAGFGGQAVRYAWMPVTVHLEPRSLFSGNVEVTTSGGVTETRQVEVAGGAAKEFTFIVAAGAVRVRVIPDGSSEAVQLRPDIDGRPNGALVGLATTEPAVPAGLPQVELVATTTRAVWVGADPTLLEQTHLAVTSLATFVMTLDDVAALTDVGRANLERAVLDGLNLVVVAPVGPVDLGLAWAPVLQVRDGSARGLPTVVPADDAWLLTVADADLTPAQLASAGGSLDPTTPLAGSVPAGLGRVTVTGVTAVDSAAPRAWAHLAAERDATARLDGEATQQGGWIAQQAMSSGGALDVPSLRLLAIFALAYLLAAGPGNALLLRRLGRRELGWVTLPGITVVFVAISFAVASGTQPKIGVSGSAVAWADGRATEVTVAAVRAPSAGQHDVLLPGPAWSVQSTQDFSGTAPTLDRSTGNVRASFELQSLQVGLVFARRPVDEAPPMNVTATVTGDDVEVEVVNVSPRALTELQVRAGGHRLDLGDLGPGESATGTLKANRLQQLEVYVDLFQDSRNPDGSVRSPGSFRGLLAAGLLGDRPGMVVVVADDADAPSEVLADDAATDSLGRVVAVGTTVTGTGDVLPLEVGRTLVVGTFQEGWQPSVHAVEGELTAHLRYRLPGRAAGRVSGVTTDLARGQGSIQARPGLMEPGIPELIDPNIGPCIVVQDSFPDGSGGESASCGPGNEFEAPPCPADAVSCDFAVDSWTFEWDDGRVQTGRLTNANGFDQPMPLEPPVMDGGNPAFLELFDHASGRWVLLDDVGADPIAGRYVSPFGEVFVRASGGLYPFDYSARGIGARLSGVRA